jgi:dipeptidyl aminopeptidase/acylaminoacyl peptidase
MTRRNALLFSMAFSLSLFGQSAPRASGNFTIEQVMSAPFASHPLAAPKGARVAWLLDEQGRRNIWVASGPEWHGQKITHFDVDDGQEIDELSWAPDGSQLFFARGGDFETHRDNPNPALSPEKPEQAIWAVSMDGSTPKRLTEGHAPVVSPGGDLVAFLRGGQIFTMKPSGEDISIAVSEKSPSGLRWSPDGKRLAFVSARGDHGFIGIYSFAPKSLQYLDASVDHDTDPIWSPDGAHIAYVRIPTKSRPFMFGPERTGEPWSIRVAGLDNGLGREVFRASAGKGSVFHAIDSAQQLFWTANDRLVFPWEQTGWCHLYSVPVAGGIAQELTPGEGEVENASASSDGHSIFYASNISDIDRRHVWRLSIDDSSASPKLVTPGENIQLEPTPLADGSALVYLESSFNQKVQAMVRVGGGNAKALAPETTPVDFPLKALVKPQPVLITAADGLQIHGQIFLPKDAGASRHPALIFFHGGSRRQMLLGFHYMYYYSNAYAMNQYLASQGYVVLSVNYRSGIGYGLDFREALNYGATGASEFNDVIGAGLYLKSRPDVDPKRIGVWGGSYGGYLTALALARASDLFAVGVDFHGVHDWNLEIQNFVPAYDPKGQADAARIAFESSPLASVATWKSPVLLIQGDDDRNVTFTQTVRLAEALREQHVTFEQLIFPNEIHDFLLYRHWVEAYKATAEFFSRKLVAETAASRNAR